MRSAESRKVNVLEIKCLRSLVGVSRMDRVRNEEVCRTAGIERQLASRADQRVLKWFGLLYGLGMWKEWMARRVLIIIIILLKQDYKIQLANNKIQMAWLTCWLVVW